MLRRVQTPWCGLTLHRHPLLIKSDDDDDADSSHAILRSPSLVPGLPPILDDHDASEDGVEIADDNIVWSPLDADYDYEDSGSSESEDSIEEVTEEEEAHHWGADHNLDWTHN